MVRAVRRSPPNTPEKRKTLETLQQFEALWNDIIKTFDEHFALTLREAANVIGFALFPVGWIWDEYPGTRGQEPTYIERKAHPHRCRKAAATAYLSRRDSSNRHRFNRA